MLSLPRHGSSSAGSEGTVRPLPAPLTPRPQQLPKDVLGGNRRDNILSAGSRVEASEGSSLPEAGAAPIVLGGRRAPWAAVSPVGDTGHGARGDTSSTGAGTGGCGLGPGSPRAAAWREVTGVNRPPPPL